MNFPLCKLRVVGEDAGVTGVGLTSLGVGVDAGDGVAATAFEATTGELEGVLVIWAELACAGAIEAVTIRRFGGSGLSDWTVTKPAKAIVAAREAAPQSGLALGVTDLEGVILERGRFCGRGSGVSVAGEEAGWESFRQARAMRMAPVVAMAWVPEHHLQKALMAKSWSPANQIPAAGIRSNKVAAIAAFRR